LDGAHNEEFRKELQYTEELSRNAADPFGKLCE